MVAMASCRGGTGAAGAAADLEGCSNVTSRHGCRVRGHGHVALRVHHHELHRGAVLQAVQHRRQARGADAHRAERGVVADEAHRVGTEGVAGTDTTLTRVIAASSRHHPCS